MQATDLSTDYSIGTTILDKRKHSFPGQFSHLVSFCDVYYNSVVISHNISVKDLTNSPKNISR